jgi:membrane protease YdiL (CAAX protease family)
MYLMLLSSPLGLLMIGAVISLAVLGVVVYSGIRIGWMKNGYFTLPSVLLIVSGLFIVFQALGSTVMIAAVGTHIEVHPLAALSINGLAELIVLLCGTVYLSTAARQNLFAIFRLEGFHETPAQVYLLAVPIILVAQLGGSAISVLGEHVWKLFPSLYHALDQYESASDASVQGLVTAHGPMDFLLIMLFVAIVPALAEETLFRGFAQTNIERSGKRQTRPYLALLVASIFFAMVHGSVFKFPGLLALGLALGWMTYRTNNLFTGALAHAINNGFIVVALYLNPEQFASKTTGNLVGTDELSGTDALMVLAPVIVLMALLLFFFNKMTAPLQARRNAEREFEARLAFEHSVHLGTITDEHSTHPNE